MITAVGVGPLLSQDDGGAPSEENMIQQRLRSDLQDMREENRELRERIQELETSNRSQSSGEDSSQDDNTDSRQIRELRQENERLREQLSEFRNLLSQLTEKVEGLELADDVELVSHESVEESNSNESRENKEEVDRESEWIEDSDRPYPIRRDPLQEEIEYTTGADDTLSKIAHQFYHDAELWIRIYLVNENRLDSPDSLPPGTVLRLPPIHKIKQ